jgi:hypothetical protein
MDAKLREQLGKLLGKLESDQDGERANAASLCTKLLREHRLTWADVVAGKLTDGEQETGQAFNHGYVQGFADGFTQGIKQGREEAPRRAKAIRRALTEKEGVPLLQRYDSARLGLLALFAEPARLVQGMRLYRGRHPAGLGVSRAGSDHPAYQLTRRSLWSRVHLSQLCVNMLDFGGKLGAATEQGSAIEC